MVEVSDEPLYERDNFVNFPSETISIEQVNEFKFVVEVGVSNEMSENKYMNVTRAEVMAVTPFDAEQIAHHIAMGETTALMAQTIREAEA